MLIVGLTGKTGAGKSDAARSFQKWGFGVVDCDRIAKEVVQPGCPCLAELSLEFGAEIIKENGELDRSALAQAAFTNKEKLSRLNAITHKYILEKVDRQLEEYKQKGCKAVIVDGAALFESGFSAHCDKNVVIKADRSIRLARIMNRDNLPLERAEERISAQNTDSFYDTRADHIIENNGDKEALDRAVEKTAKLLLKDL